MQIQQLYSYVRRAMDDYHMIQDGDMTAMDIDVCHKNDSD